jgi:hypothetical protein
MFVDSVQDNFTNSAIPIDATQGGWMSLRLKVPELYDLPFGAGLFFIVIGGGVFIQNALVSSQGARYDFNRI